MLIRCTLIATILFISACSNESISDKSIIGDWCADSESTFHKEFSLSIEDGEHKFSSWLHQRPALFGKWKLEEHNLTIESGEKFIFSYTVEMENSNKLILREKDQEPELYIRHNENCVQFEIENSPNS